MSETDLRAGQRPYEIGLGPVEQLRLRVERGEISQEHAEELARRPDFAASVGPAYAHALSNNSFGSALKGDWRLAVRQQRLLIEALSARPASPESERALRVALLHWLQIAAVALTDIPDGRLYRRALADGERLIAGLGRDDEMLGDAYHNLGMLHLDPYTAGRSSDNYDFQIRLWTKRFSDEMGGRLVSIPEEARRMPEPPVALGRAEEHFREAAKLRQGHWRGASLKALATALVWQEVVGRKIDRAELARVCRESLAALEPGLRPDLELTVMTTLRRIGQPYDLERVRRIAETPTAELLRRLPPNEVLTILGQAVSLLTADEPAYCLDLLGRSRELFRRHGGENVRMNFHQTCLLMLRLALAPEPARDKPRWGLARAARKLRDHARKKGLGATALSAGLFSLAGYSMGLNEERVGLELLAEASQTDPRLTAEHAETFTFLHALLLLGTGSNAHKARDWQGSVNGYASAITPFLNLGLAGHALDCVARITDVVSKHPEDPGLAKLVAAHFTGALALRLETEVGETAAEALQDLYKRTMLSAISGPINPLVLTLVMQLGKGLRFGTALLRGSGYDPARDGRCAELLPHVREAEAALAGASGDDGEPLLDEDTLLTSYVRAGDRRSGDTPRERLSNLQQSFDSLMNAGLLKAAGDGAAGVMLDDYVNQDELKGALGERTVLLDFYLGGAPDGSTAAFALLATRETMEVSCVTQPFPDSLISMGDDERELLCSPFALMVQAVRRSVLEFPGPWPVAEDAGKILSDYMRGYLGNFVERLEQLAAAGKNHLLIVPHGPLHFYPLHLLGEPGRPLADKWKVSYLPNLRLLKRAGATPARRRSSQVAALGLTFGDYNPHGQEPLAEAEAEARAVAEVFGVSPVLDEAATREAAFEALGAARYVHVATHGKHNVDAPAFQLIYLAPSERSDGRLFAHELLSLDLRGVELLTLSACETALGRFDRADNLRGLPASFLLAGVESLVGTLWPVESAAAELFFRTIYAELKAGRTRLDAFAAAQQRTRAEFDKYHQWGPFYLMGAWD